MTTQTRIQRTLNFCDHGPTPGFLNTEKVSQATQDVSQQPIESGPYYPAYRSDPLAADKPGEELLPEASVWHIYKKEANDYDNELVRGRKENLDTLLIFAALFSAVLAAFLVESIGLLEEDPAEKSAALLLILFKSQLGAANVSSTSLNDPSFAPSPSSRLVNGLWLVALALSLAAASLAMLAKEWLDSFTASHKREAHAFAVTRQARLDGFEAWNAPLIMDLLPTLLHISLLFFALGLVIHLWRIDRVIAAILSSIIGLQSLMYQGTTVCGAYFDLCPFVTQLSRSLRTGFRLGREFSDGNLDEQKPPIGEDNCTTTADVRALAWLARNARDEESSKVAYQALAGLAKRPMRGPPPHESKQEYKKWLQEQRNASEFLGDCSLRFESTLVNFPRQLAKCQGENVIRYARALPEIATYMGNFTKKWRELPGTRRGSHDRMKLADTANKTLFSIFGSLDMLWTGKYALNARTYAYVIAAEFRLIQSAVANTNLGHSPDSQPPPNLTARDRSPVRIDMDSAGQKSTVLDLAEASSRYAASLSCAIFLIRCHVSSLRGGSLDNQALYELLEAMKTTTVFFMRLPPPYLQSLYNENVVYSVSCHNDGASFQPISGEGLITLLELTSTPSLSLPFEVIHASAGALYAIGLLYRPGLDNSNRSTLSHWQGELEAIDTWPNSTEGPISPIKWVVRVARLSMSDYRTLHLIEASLSSLLQMIESTYSTLSKEQQIDLGESIDSWSQHAKSCLIKILACNSLGYQLWSCDNKTVLREIVQALLGIIQQTPDHGREVALLLDDLGNAFDQFDNPTASGSIEDIGAAPDDPWLRYFTAELGFDQLAKIGRSTDYAPSVARITMRLCTGSCLRQKGAIELCERLQASPRAVDERDLWETKPGMDIVEEYRTCPLIPRTQIISIVALPGFLAAVSIALDHIQKERSDGTASDSYFVEHATKLLDVSLVASHGDFDETCGIKAGEVAQRLCEHGAPKLEGEAANIVVLYGQYPELPVQTEEEIKTLQDERCCHGSILAIGHIC